MSRLAEILARNEEPVRNDWLDNMSKTVQRADLMTGAELREQSHRLLGAIVRGLKADESAQLSGAVWTEAKELLQEISASRAHQGFTPSETANFVFSLKQPLYNTIRKEISDADDLFRAVTAITLLLDNMALLTMETFMARREELISRQQQELLELSTPVVKLWDGILALPIIGTLDSARTQIVMENLLQTVVATNSKYAIIDITGVPTVDTLVAQHLPEDHHRGTADGRRVHHQRRASADCADHRPPRYRSDAGHHQSETVGCLRPRAAKERSHRGSTQRYIQWNGAQRPHDGRTGEVNGTNSDSSDGLVSPDHHPGRYA